MCEAEFEQTAINDRFCSKYCVQLHKNKMCNERWLKAKPKKRNPNASNLFASTASYIGQNASNSRYMYDGGS